MVALRTNTFLAQCEQCQIYVGSYAIITIIIKLYLYHANIFINSLFNVHSHPQFHIFLERVSFSSRLACWIFCNSAILNSLLLALKRQSGEVGNNNVDSSEFGFE